MLRQESDNGMAAVLSADNIPLHLFHGKTMIYLSDSLTTSDANESNPFRISRKMDQFELLFAV